MDEDEVRRLTARLEGLHQQDGGRMWSANDEMPDRSQDHQQWPLKYIGAPVHVNYDTGEVHPVGRPDPDASAGQPA